MNKFKEKTCNTIDDVTGMIVKLSETSKRWDGIRCTELNWETRQPQDFAVTPKPIKVYQDSRADIAEPVPTAYNPANGWSYPT